jgi:phosphoglycolate phosphatase-like HAD superfamily hydrolase
VVTKIEIMTEQCFYALDFDGVICDSAIETGITGWKTATQLWSDMSGELPAQPLLDSFRRVRPVLETGYEAILIMRLLFQGVNADTLLNNFSQQIQTIIQKDNLDTEYLKQLFGKTRDHWIEHNLQQWIAMNPLFPGIAEKLRTLNTQGSWYIITTKQERFVKQILYAYHIELADERIYGLDRDMSKVAVLQQLLKAHPDQSICFIEDRLPTLHNVMQHEDLTTIQLFLASWGYNTDQDRNNVHNSQITLINIEQFPG